MQLVTLFADPDAGAAGPHMSVQTH
jgi:hypothetical protein